MKKLVVLTCVLGTIISQTNTSRAVGVGAAGAGPGAGAGVSVQTGAGGQGAAVNSGTANTGGSLNSSSSSGSTSSGATVNGTAGNNGTAVNGSSTAFTPGGTTANPNVQVQQQPYAPAGTYSATNGGTPNYTATNQYSSSSNMPNQYAHTNGFNGTNGWALRRQFEQNQNTTFGASSDRGFTEFDQTLIQRVRRVVFDPNAQLSTAGNGVSMTAQNGTVTVNGVVATPADAQLIVNNVQTVPGVVNVASRLVIDPNAANVYARSRAQNAQARTATGQRFLAPTSDPGLGNAVYSSNRNVAPTSTNIDASVTGGAVIGGADSGTVSNTTTTSSSSNP